MIKQKRNFMAIFLFVYILFIIKNDRIFNPAVLTLFFIIYYIIKDNPVSEKDYDILQIDWYHPDSVSVRNKTEIPFANTSVISESIGKLERNTKNC